MPKLKVSAREQARRERLFTEHGPRWVRVYDNGGESGDRYTVVYTGRAAPERSAGNATEYPYRAMSASPFHPQGIGIYGSTPNQPCDTLGEKRGWNWPPAIGRKCHLGKRVSFYTLPRDCQACAMQDYSEIWRIPYSIALKMAGVPKRLQHTAGRTTSPPP